MSTSLIVWMAVCCPYEPCRKQRGARTEAGPSGFSIRCLTVSYSLEARVTKFGLGFSRPKNQLKWLESACTAMRKLVRRCTTAAGVAGDYHRAESDMEVDEAGRATGRGPL